MDLTIINMQHGSTAALPAPKAPQTAFEHQARKAADNFEALFLAQYLNTMSAGIKNDGPFNGGHSEEMFQSVLNEEMATSITRRGGIGLSDMVYREILKTQEAEHSAPLLSPSQIK
ncbi:MAG: hypothetical protein CMF31_10870 [Kordiimonas sp.]|nr:hypothetical protein [Kordiimonas sp.]|tara:strand:+ start:53 stop:400 length:348 start_codon:yes stop_codon:yes gene_type:complete